MLTSTAEPPHEMLLMKLPAELFRGTIKTRTKETVTRLFLLAWGLRKTPHFGNCSCQSFPQESSDRPYLYDSKV